MLFRGFPQGALSNCDARLRKVYGVFPACTDYSSSDGNMKAGIWHALEVVTYRSGLAIQDRVADERARGVRPDTLLLLQHPPTITLGRRASCAEVLWDSERLGRAGITVERVGRGGRATLHVPGQLVGYVIVRLGHGGRSVRVFVEGLEALLLDVARSFGVRAENRTGHPGVWVGPRKLASIGIEVRSGISRHGFALNVDVDLAPFRSIVSCGVPDLEMTDLSREARATIPVDAAIESVVHAWRVRFGALEEEAWNELEAAG
jgi:lipoate-protein ligase B